jgi:hypothetical protein
MTRIFAVGDEKTLIQFKSLLEKFPFAAASDLWIMAGGWVCPHDNQTEVSGKITCDDCGVELENENETNN